MDSYELDGTMILVPIRQFFYDAALKQETLFDKSCEAIKFVKNSTAALKISPNAIYFCIRFLLITWLEAMKLTGKKTQQVCRSTVHPNYNRILHFADLPPPEKYIQKYIQLIIRCLY